MSTETKAQSSVSRTKSGSGLRLDSLPNGLKLIGEMNASRQSAALGFFVKTGSRDESAKESGVSHFLEHMMFKGTAQRSALDITYELGNLGAQANAFTSEENTVFYAAILPEYFSKMQELLSDMLRPALDGREFDTEKKVILEEIALYQDRPQFYLFEHALKDYFGEHPAGNSVLGSSESISALTRDEMQDYFDRRYCANNMALVASGVFDWDQFVAGAQALCGSWPAASAPRLTKPYPARSAYREFRKQNIVQTHVVFVSEGAGAQDEERYAFSVLSLIIGDSSGSKFYWELLDKGLAESAGCDNDERDGTGIFMGYASTEKERLEEVSEIMRRILGAAGDFSEDDLERAKTKLAAKIVFGGELPMGRLMALGVEWNYRHKVEGLAEVISKIRSLSRADILEALSRFSLAEWSEYRLLPE